MPVLRIRREQAAGNGSKYLLTSDWFQALQRKRGEGIRPTTCTESLPFYLFSARLSPDQQNPSIT